MPLTRRYNRPVKRWTSRILTAFCTLFLLAILCVWLRGYWIADHWEVRFIRDYRSPGDIYPIETTIRVASNTGGLGVLIERQHWIGNTVNRWIDPRKTPFESTWTELRPIDPLFHQAYGRNPHVPGLPPPFTADVRESVESYGDKRELLGFGTSRSLAESPQGPYMRSHSFWAPTWSLALLFALLPLRRLTFFFRRRLRRSHGHCPICNYDLRSSPDRCPECGTPRPSSIRASCRSS